MRRWILLRGLAREAGHWGDFADLLAARTREPVLRLDFPGNGALHSARSLADVASMAGHARAAAAGRGPVVLVAMSLGAMAAIEWCCSAPEAVAGCVLVNTSASGTSRPWHRLQPRQYPTVLRLLAPGLSALERERRVLAMTSARPQAHAQAAAEWARLATRHPVSAANVLRQLWAAARYRAPERPPSAPMLLLASAGDRLVSPMCSRQLAARWQVPLRLHPWAGHDLPLDDPDWVLAEILRWSRSLAA